MNASSNWKSRLIVGAAWCFVALLVIPILVAFPVSLTPHAYLSMPQDEVSFRHYRQIFEDEEWRVSMAQSLVVAVASSAIAVLLGTLSAIGLWKISSRASEAVRMFLLLPMIVPPIVSALAFYKVWADLRMLDSYVGLVIAHAVLTVPYVVVTVSASLSTLGRTIELAARNLGANTWQTLWHVILPSIRTGIASGALFAFILSWDELVVTLFISGRAIVTLPRRMWDGIRDNVNPSIAAVSSVFILLTCVVMAVHAVRAGRKARSRTGTGI
jgi:putative spermidine/putrescine transport system permease protein